EVVEVAPLDGLDPGGFASQSLRRFGNRALGHTCIQVGTDGSKKLPQRLLPVMDIRSDHGLDVTRFATVIAIWLAAVNGTEITGIALPCVDDPAGSIIRNTMTTGAATREQITEVLFEVFGERINRHLDLIVESYERVASHGIQALEQRP
ncbi:MAG: hypothetical protein KDB26_09205, partial [Microthrixaceae bacterium]|nr:hypothetical protein [Microthrixaceae bacterium]